MLFVAVSAPLPGQDAYVRDVPQAKAPPVIDGSVEPGEWDGALVIDDFKQIQPVEGADPREKTVVLLLVDKDNLYFAFQCFDSQPGGIRASLMTRDAVLDPDDRVEFVIDSFLDRRNAFFFQIGAGGSKGDGLISPGFFTKDWNGIWQGEATVHEKGWTGEVAMPAKTLSMTDSHAAFGLNMTRYVKRTNETLQWASPRRNTRIFNISTAGTIRGMEVLDQGIGLDFKPYVNLSGLRDHDRGSNDHDFEAGFDLVYKITPGLTGTLTVNTDFAETEVDDRVVNLTRFPVFFPEKRDFFLEDAGVFSFGSGGSGGFLPFFSRRIGLDEAGDPVTIYAGLKVTGRIDKLAIGALDVQLAKEGDLDAKNLAVLRLAYDVLEQSSIGTIFTYGDPNTNGDNAVAGFDFRFRTNDFMGDKQLRIDAWVLGSQDDPAPVEDDRGQQTGYAYSLRVQYPNDIVEALVRYREVSDDYQADLGFVGRRGVRNLNASLEWNPRPGGSVRNFSFGVSANPIWSIEDGEIDTLEVEVVPLAVQLESGDAFGIEFTPTIERLTDPFDIREDVVIPRGRYSFDRFRVFLEASDRRSVSGELSYETGGFFSGERDVWEFDVTWRMANGFRMSVGLEYNDVDLDEGSFTTLLATLRTTMDFSPRLSWSTFVQYDDVSDTIGINSRILWILQPGDEVFVVLNHGFTTRDEDEGRWQLSSTETSLTVKVALTFRF